MTKKTQILPDKVRAYLATAYRIAHTLDNIVLIIGQRSQRLADLYAVSGVECGAFLTAYNPQGAMQSDAANERAHADLAALLREQGISAIEGSGGEEDSD